MKGFADPCSNSRVAPAPHRTTYCGHDGAREIRIYSQYADANATRLRAAGAAALENLDLSRLYAIPGGWGWTICRECRLLERAA
jgi:hypothetical protein